MEIKNFYIGDLVKDLWKLGQISIIIGKRKEHYTGFYKYKLYNFSDNSISEEILFTWLERIEND
jgi:hypothetical protein